LRLLIDTSVWIDFLRGTPSRENVFFKESLRQREHIFVAGVIVQETLQGIRDDSQHRRLSEFLLLFPRIETVFSDYVAAADIYRVLRKKGITLESPTDCLIASLAIKADVFLLHKDSDFTVISRHFPLSVMQPV
jgi:predicted nucleic acid-binding protein